MKNLLIISFCFVASLVYSQSPEGFKYQAVIRDASNTILTNQNVGIQITIQQGSIGGTSIYTETFSPTTNDYGLINLEIGSGVTTDNFSTIDWSNGPYFVETGLDVTGGISYAVMGTNQLMSVPYALYAKEAETVTNDAVDDADANPLNEIQDITLSGTDLTISSGSTVDLSGIDTDTQLDSTGVANLGFVAGAHTIDTDTDDQTLNLSGTDLSIDGGNTIDISSIDTDTQLDSTDITNLGFVAGAHTIDTDTDDQTLSLSGTDLSIDGGNTIDISSIDTDTDTQLDSTDIANLGFVAGTHTIDTDTDDQTLSLSGTDLSIDGGNAIDISGVNTDDQNLSLSANVISIDDGNSVDLSSISPLSMEDTDGDTKIQVEESTDEDIIRFDMAGTQYFVMDGPRLVVDNSGSSVFIGEDAGVSDDLTNNKNVFIGFDAGESNVNGNNNVAVGAQSLTDNVSGDWNVAIGYQTLQNSESESNIAIGAQVARNKVEGTYNIAIGSLTADEDSVCNASIAMGFSSMRYRKEGNYNIGLGYYSQANANGGFGNIAMGSYTLYETTGNKNIAFGQHALRSSQSGNDNIALGESAMRNALSAAENIAIGDNSGRENETGNYNVFLGGESGRNSTGSSNVFIGHNAGYNETGSDLLYIENSNSSTPLIWGDFANDDVRINGDFNVTGNIEYTGTITDVSDRRLKENLKPIDNVLEKIDQINGYSYNMIGDSAQTREYGVMAQEIMEVFPEMVKELKNREGYFGVSYIQLVPILLEGVKEQRKVISKHEEEINTLRKEVEELKALIMSTMNEVDK